MSREVRRVSKDWEHPKSIDGNYISLDERSWIDYYDESEYDEKLMPDWKEDELTHIQMYETVSEGTPISPVLETKEELAKWLSDNKANAGFGTTATYDQWLNTIERGYAVTMVMDSNGVHSGVSV